MPENASTSPHPDTHRADRIVGVVCVILSVLIFGSTFAANKHVLNQNLDPILFAFLRAVIASVFLFLFYALEGRHDPWTAREWKLVALIGCGAAAVAQVLEYTGTKYTTASNASLIMSNESVLAMILSFWILKEALRASTVVGAVWAFFGMALVMFDDIRTAEFHTGSGLWGDLLVLGSIFAWGFYTVFSKLLLKHSTPVAALLFVSLFNSAALGLYCLATGSLPQVADINETAWIGILYLGCVGSALGHLFYFLALRRLPASLVSLALSMLPVCGVAFSILLLGESLSWTKLFGGLVIVVSVGYAIWPREPVAVPTEPVKEPELFPEY